MLFLLVPAIIPLFDAFVNSDGKIFRSPKNYAHVGLKPLTNRSVWDIMGKSVKNNPKLKADLVKYAKNDGAAKRIQAICRQCH